MFSMAGIPPTSLEKYLMLAESDRRPVALNPELNPYTTQTSDVIATLNRHATAAVSAVGVFSIHSPVPMGATPSRRFPPASRTVT